MYEIQMIPIHILFNYRIDTILYSTNKRAQSPGFVSAPGLFFWSADVYSPE